MSRLESQSHQYTRYEDIDKEQLQKDIEEAKATIGEATQEDFEHLLKMERWGRMFTFSGYFLIAIISLDELKPIDVDYYWTDDTNQLESIGAEWRPLGFGTKSGEWFEYNIQRFYDRLSKPFEIQP
jgi:hypothetical protein